MGVWVGEYECECGCVGGIMPPSKWSSLQCLRTEPEKACELLRQTVHSTPNDTPSTTIAAASVLAPPVAAVSVSMVCVLGVYLMFNVRAGSGNSLSV